MTSITADDLVRMRANLLFDGDDRADRLSKFWILLALASAIASAGVIGDSTATVIGAMIVAPLMTPIMGSVLSITTSDRINLVRCLGLVLAGAAAAIAIGFVFGLLSPIDIVAETSSQVAGRVRPRLIDLTAAIATGAAGAFAQCRADVADTLPGVAIAISLVPPLTVVGLTLQAGEVGQSLGALLLFVTNFSAILLVGCVVMSSFGVHRVAAVAERGLLDRRRAQRVIVALVAVIAIPLVAASVTLTRDQTRAAELADVSRAWAEETGWLIVDIGQIEDEFVVLATGPLPVPDASALRLRLDAAGLAGHDVVLRLVPEERILLSGG